MKNNENPPAPSGHTAARQMNQTSILQSFLPFLHPCILRLLFACSVCLFASACLLFACFHLLFAAIVWLLVGPTARQIAVKNHVPLLLGLPEFACGSSAVHIFAFGPYQARTYMHHTCHSTAICPKSPQSGTKVPPKCSKVTPKCTPSSIKLIK